MDEFASVLVITGQVSFLKWEIIWIGNQIIYNTGEILDSWLSKVVNHLAILSTIHVITVCAAVSVYQVIIILNS